MEVNTGRAAFDVNEVCETLRKPHSRSKPLSLAAEVFVPRSRDVSSPVNNSLASHSNPSPQPFQESSIQKRLQRYQHPGQYAAVDCASYSTNASLSSPSVQSRLDITDKTNFDSNSNNLSPTEVETIAMSYLSTVIQFLNDNPGSFDTVATRFLTIFEGMENNQYILSNAMEDIFNHSIQNPNFRYMGAKLYNLLHMLNLRDDSLFHTLLKCKLEYHQAEIMEFMQNNSEQKVRETALFLAELYMQLRGDDLRIKLIAENIVFSLKQLLNKITADNVRCICLTLKLTGFDLDTDCPIDVGIIMKQLEIINKETPGKYPLVQNVISLKKNNWGRTIMPEHTTVSNSASESSYKASTEPTFYGPDGQIITEEESQFLAGSLSGTPSSVEDDDAIDSDVDLDPGMDDETINEYINFCKLSK